MLFDKDVGFLHKALGCKRTGVCAELAACSGIAHSIGLENG
jgi:hypothetical protein